MIAAEGKWRIGVRNVRFRCQWTTTTVCGLPSVGGYPTHGHPHLCARHMAFVAESLYLERKARQ